MKTIRTAILDELYEHFVHNLEGHEALGTDPETDNPLVLQYQSVRRDEGRLILRVLVSAPGGSPDAKPAQRELNITVEKS